MFNSIVRKTFIDIDEFAFLASTVIWAIIGGALGALITIKFCYLAIEYFLPLFIFYFVLLVVLFGGNQYSLECTRKATKRKFAKFSKLAKCVYHLNMLGGIAILFACVFVAFIHKSHSSFYLAFTIIATGMIANAYKLETNKNKFSIGNYLSLLMLALLSTPYVVGLFVNQKNDSLDFFVVEQVSTISAALLGNIIAFCIYDKSVSCLLRQFKDNR